MKKKIENLKPISNDTNYSKFNISPTLSLRNIKLPPRNSIHQRVSNNIKKLAPISFKYIVV
jgi:hypothetical protein